MPIARRAVLASVTVLPAITRAQGSSWTPSGPIRVIVPQPPGASMDLITRQLAQFLQSDLGQPVIVENRAGAGTMVGTEAAARAAPDGHTLLVVFNSFLINTAMRPNLPYDPMRDFEPIALLTVVPHVLVAHPRIAADFAGFLTAARRAGPGLSFGSYGIGTSNHLGVEQLKAMAGLNVTHVPYRGGEAYPDLYAGRIDFMFANQPDVLQPSAAGQVRPLAIAASRRSLRLPDVPTLAELGYPALLSDTWFGVVAPAGLRPEVAARHGAAWLAALSRPEMRSDLDRRGIEPLGIGSAEFTARLRRDLAIYAEVVKASNIKPE